MGDALHFCSWTIRRRVGATERTQIFKVRLALADAQLVSGAHAEGGLVEKGSFACQEGHVDQEVDVTLGTGVSTCQEAMSTLVQMARGNPREGGEEEEDSGKKPHVERGV